MVEPCANETASNRSSDRPVCGKATDPAIGLECWGEHPPATEHRAQSVETPVHVVVWHQPVISRLHRTNREEPKVAAVNMGQSMVAIEASDCTGCDLCIPFCPFEALLPLASTPPNVRRRPVIVLDDACVGCLSCIGSCPTGALAEVIIPPPSEASPLLNPRSQPATVRVDRWGPHGTRWP